MTYPQAKPRGPFLPLTEASMVFVFTHFFFLRVHLLTLRLLPDPIHSFSEAQSHSGCPLFLSPPCLSRHQSLT